MQIGEIVREVEALPVDPVTVPRPEETPAEAPPARVPAER